MARTPQGGSATSGGDEAPRPVGGEASLRGTEERLPGRARGGYLVWQARSQVWVQPRWLLQYAPWVLLTPGAMRSSSLTMRKRRFLSLPSLGTSSFSCLSSRVSMGNL